MRTLGLLVAAVMLAVAGVWDTVAGRAGYAVAWLSLSSALFGLFVVVHGAETRLAVESRNDWRDRYFAEKGERQVGYRPRQSWVVGFKVFDRQSDAEKYARRHGGVARPRFERGGAVPRPPEFNLDGPDSRPGSAFCPGRPGSQHGACREVGASHQPHWFPLSLRGCCLTPTDERCTCKRPEGLPGWMPWPADEDPAPETTAAIFRLDAELARAAASRALLDQSVVCAVCGLEGLKVIGPHRRPDDGERCQK